MADNNFIMIELKYLEFLADAAVFECDDHVIAFTSQPGYEYHSWTTDKLRMMNLITCPLRDAWQTYSGEQRDQARLALQYVLNKDETVPYTKDDFIPGLFLKHGGFLWRHFSSNPNLIMPNDSYIFCEWLWEILFPDEDWHADISNWVVVEPKIEKLNP